MSFVVAGASGRTGRVVAESLLSQKRAVRVVVRRPEQGEAWKAKGAAVAIADLGDARALAAALAGAEGAYLLVPTPPTEPDFGAYQDHVADAIVSAVETSGVPRVVFLSSIGAQVPSGTGPIAGLHRAEEKLRRLAGTATTFLRAGYFMENVAASLGGLERGALASFLPADLPIEMTATQDIGGLAAELLLERDPRSQVVELGGPSVTTNDVAAAVARITGRPVRVEVAPLDAVVPAFTSFGFSPDVAGRYREMLQAYIERRIAFEGGHRRVAGTTPLESVLRALLAR